MTQQASFHRLQLRVYILQMNFQKQCTVWICNYAIASFQEETRWKKGEIIGNHRVTAVNPNCSLREPRY
jgi:hypothetical protein